MSLYRWLLLIHLAGLSTFLVAHGFSAAAAFGMRGRESIAESRLLLTLSRRADGPTYLGLLVVIVTGVWMGFLGGWWGHAWIWASIAVLVAVLVVMGLVSRPYFTARTGPDETLGETLARARPLTATWAGSAAIAALLLLMVLKPF